MASRPSWALQTRLQMTSSPRAVSTRYIVTILSLSPTHSLHALQIDRLLDRVTSSTLLEDRRDACRHLKSLSRKYRKEVGAIGIPALIQILEHDRADCETIGYALETLCNITNREQFEEELENPQVSETIGEQFTEMFIKDAPNVALVLSYLEEFDFKVRWPAVRLLTTLLDFKPKELQEIVLVSPMGISKLMDLLSDSREIIRNDALILLIHLTKGNANIQKIVAFENAFDRLFDVCRDEGASDGGIVVEDCLILMLRLLKNNSSNQQFFKEGSFVHRLAQMFVMQWEVEESDWTPQKVSNVQCMLQIVRALVYPSNTQQIVTSCQDVMKTSGLLETLCNILMSSRVPAEVLTETINTVGEIVRGNATNQTLFSHVMAPSNPPRQAIVLLLMSMVNEKQPLPLRCAVLYCFQCFLYRNEAGQSALVQTLLPTSADVSHSTQGQWLCHGLFSPDPLTNWFSASALMYGLVENPAQKEQLLRVLLAPAVGQEPVSLLHQCCVLLQQCRDVHSKVGLLMLLSEWLSHCPVAVKSFLGAKNSVAYLIAQVGGANEHDEAECLVQGLCAFIMGLCIQFNDNSEANYRREDLCQLIVKRISTEAFQRKLGEVSKHEGYTRAGKQPQIWMNSKHDVLLDFEFCKLFKALETVLTKTVAGFASGGPAESEMDVSAVVHQYKGIIREQDGRITGLEQRLGESDAQRAELERRLVEMQAVQSQYQDQNILLRAQLSAATDLVTSQQKIAGLQVQDGGGMNSDSEASVIRAENERLTRDLELIRGNLREASEKLVENGREMEKLRKDQEDLLELLTDQDTKMSAYRRQLRSYGAAIEPSDDEEEEEDVASKDEVDEKPESNAESVSQQQPFNYQLPMEQQPQVPLFHVPPSQPTVQYNYQMHSPPHPPPSTEQQQPQQQSLPDGSGAVNLLNTYFESKAALQNGDIFNLK